MVLLLLVALISPARALGVAGEENIARNIEAAMTAVRGNSDEAVSGRGAALQKAIEDSLIRFRPSLHEVQRPVPAEKKVEVEDMVRDAQSRMTGSRKLASSELQANVASQAQLYSEGRMAYDPSLPDGAMGVYRFLKHRVHDGAIALNDWMREMGLIVPIEFLAAVGVHEAGHRDNADLARQGVIEGEIVSFQRQYEWLTFVDPTGEKLALLRLLLEAQMKRHPNPLTRKALEFATTLDVLVGTKGDRENIRKYVLELGYREGQGRHEHDDGHDHLPPSA